MKIKMSYSICLILLGLIMIVGCKSQSVEQVMSSKFPKFYIEGHRGTRGLMPENTIPSMIKAVQGGANVLELDVQISRDGKVMVHHDAAINPKLTLMENGNDIADSGARKILYAMDYADIRTYDVGSKYNEAFPEQEKVKTHIPLLGELIDSVQAYTRGNNLPAIVYNVEIKANPQKDGINHPAPDELVRLVMEVLLEKNLNQRYYIQSFDIRQLQEVRKSYPRVPVGFLTGNGKATLAQHVEKIGFKPDVFSPFFKIATDSLVAETHRAGMLFVPWTVNTEADMQRMLDIDVDGIITDFSNRLAKMKGL